MKSSKNNGEKKIETRGCVREIKIVEGGIQRGGEIYIEGRGAGEVGGSVVVEEMKTMRGRTDNNMNEEFVLETLRK